MAREAKNAHRSRGASLGSDARLRRAVFIRHGAAPFCVNAVTGRGYNPSVISGFQLEASRHRFAPLPLTAHASAYANLAFADGGSRNSSLHPPLEALGISTLAQGSREAFHKRSLRTSLHWGAVVRAQYTHGSAEEDPLSHGVLILNRRASSPYK